VVVDGADDEVAEVAAWLVETCGWPTVVDDVAVLSHPATTNADAISADQTPTDDLLRCRASSDIESGRLVSDRRPADELYQSANIIVVGRGRLD
jgi:hypothetical protein